MTLKSFKRKIIRRLPMAVAWDHAKEVDRAFDVCLESFDPANLEGACGKAEKFGFPWVLVIQLLIQLLLWWLENRDSEQRTLFKRWQREIKAINGQADE